MGIKPLTSPLVVTHGKILNIHTLYPLSTTPMSIRLLPHITCTLNLLYAVVLTKNL